MIKHHQGAIDMVDVLFKSYGAAQDETVFKFASATSTPTSRPRSIACTRCWRTAVAE